MICLQVINFSYTANYSTSAVGMLPRELQSSSRLATHADSLLFISSLHQATSSNLVAPIISQTSLSLKIAMNSLLSLDSSSTESDVSYVERSSEEGSPARNNTPAVLNSTQLSRAMARETITMSSVTSLEPQIVTIDWDSNEPTIPYGFGSQHPIKPPILKDLSLPQNPFIVLATLAVIRAEEEYSPQSPEPSIPFSISTPPLNLSTIEGWETTHTTTDDNTFYTDDDPKRVYRDISSRDTFESNEPKNVSIASSPSSTPPPPRRQKRNLNMAMSFPKKGGASQHTVRHAARPYQPKRHPNNQEKLKHYILLIKL